MKRATHRQNCPYVRSRPRRSQPISERTGRAANRSKQLGRRAGRWSVACSTFGRFTVRPVGPYARGAGGRLRHGSVTEGGPSRFPRSRTRSRSPYADCRDRHLVELPDPQPRHPEGDGLVVGGARLQALDREKRNRETRGFAAVVDAIGRKVGERCPIGMRGRCRPRHVQDARSLGPLELSVAQPASKATVASATRPP